MPRTSSSLTQGRIWLPRDRNVEWSIKISGVDITDDVLEGEFTRSIIGGESLCRIQLIDADGDYAGRYIGGETVEFLCDLSSGTASYWKGTLDKPNKKFGATYILEVIGSHLQSQLLDVTVNAEYNGYMTCDAILKELIDDFAPTFTYTNVNASTVSPTIRWAHKPIWDCIVDLCNLASFDAYVDSNKDIHFFLRESIENTTESIVWNDTLVDILKFGADNIDVKNRIIVYGEDEQGLIIVYRTDDSASQTTYGVKEKIISDNSVKTYQQAKELADATLNDEKDKADYGEFHCLLLADINPGDLIWVVNPIQQIESQLRLVKYTTKVPSRETTAIISKEKTIPQLFRQRRLAELARENVINPYNMTNSFNFMFDDLTEMDSALSAGVTVSESKLRTVSGSASGTMVSISRSSTSTITQLHLKVVGDFTSGASYQISADDGATYESINVDELKTLTTTGNLLRLKVILSSANTTIDSISLMYK